MLRSMAHISCYTDTQYDIQNWTGYMRHRYFSLEAILAHCGGAASLGCLNLTIEPLNPRYSDGTGVAQVNPTDPKRSNAECNSQPLLAEFWLVAPLWCKKKYNDCIHQCKVSLFSIVYFFGLCLICALWVQVHAARRSLWLVLKQAALAPISDIVS